MAKLVWDQTGERLYENGVRNVVLYPQASDGTYPKGVAWNGITSFSQNPTGAEPNPLYADDIKYLNLISAEELEGSIEAYMYPPEFAKCNGEVEFAKGAYIGQQARIPFGACYRTILGNDTQLEGYGYKLHLIYGATVTPSERTYETINDSPDAMTMSWDYSTTPVNVNGHKPTASLEINSTLCDSTKLKALEGILYGSETAEARLPLPDEVFTLLGAAE